MTDLTICIVSYNTKPYLQQCLESIREIDNNIGEIIIVDNASSDGSVELIQQCYHQAMLIQNKTNPGYTAAMNQALRVGSGRYLMQLNPDTIVQPGGFIPIIQYMDEHPEVGICTPRILNSDGSLQKQCRRSSARPWDVITYFTRLSSLFPKSRVFGRYLLTWAPDNEILEVEAVSGSCMLIRREVLDRVGYLDEDFFAYQEDADLCFRVREKGWKIFIFLWRK